MIAEQDLNRKIGAAVRSARLSRGVTQDDLAQFLQVDRTMISRYEHGSRTLSAPALLAIFHYLEYSLGTLDLRTYAEGAERAPLPEAVRRIVEMLQQRPDLIPTVEDVLETFLSTDEAPL